MTERAPFSSVCPKCGHDCAMTGLTNEELEHLLDAGADIARGLDRLKQR
jgi:hypothetical protein